MKADCVARTLVVSALLVLFAFPPASENSVAQSAVPPPHPLTALYRARLSGDAFASGRAWLAVDEGQRAVQAWADVPLDTLTPPELQIVADEAGRTGDFALARSALETLLTRNPNDTTAHLTLGLLLAAVSPGEALRHLQAAADDPALAALASVVQAAARQTAEAVGWTLLDGGQWPFAELAFRTAAAEPGARPLVWAGLALSRDYQGKEGDEWMNAAVARAPNEAAVFALLSIHRRVQGDLDGSLIAQQRAVALAPNSAPLLAQLGMTYQRLGRLDEAGGVVRTRAGAGRERPALCGAARVGHSI